ncbi:MAG: hypothetical protein CV087_00145 [Candidatus Brocadia sp. WS118]|nr:MAG: hypothetical protein CV087_00145 [Candidatus Brocadia sp. WS118]
MNSLSFFSPVKLSIKTVPLFLGLFIGVQVVLSPHLDVLLASYLRNIGIELPYTLRGFPFKSLLFFCPLNFVFLIIFIKRNYPWFINNKEKVFIASIIASTQLKALTGSKTEISDLVIAVVLFLWFIFTLINDYKLAWNPSFILLPLLLCSILLSYTNAGLFKFLSSFPSVFKSFLAFFIIINIITKRELVIFSLKIFFIVMTLSAIVGITQEIVLMTTGVAIVGNIPDEAKDYMWEKGTPFGQLLRVPAFTGWYILFAGYLLIAIILGVNWRLYSLVKEKKKRFFLDIAIVLMCIALYCTFSYSALVSALLGVLASIFIRWWPSAIYFIIVILIGILIACFSGVATDFVSDPKKYIISRDIEIRSILLRNGLFGFIYQHPFIGVGVGKGDRYCSDVNSWPVHNNITLVADECGILGVLIYGLFFLTLIYRQISTVLLLKNKKDTVILLSLLIGLFVYMVNLQAQATFIEVFLFIYLGILEATNRVLLSSVHRGK